MGRKGWAGIVHTHAGLLEQNLDGTRLSWPAKIRLGGTTEDLISKPGSWDLAIVSSKDVDLQKLADEGLVQEYGFVPTQDFILQQWLLPDELQGLLPEHPFLAHQVYFTTTIMRPARPHF